MYYTDKNRVYFKEKQISENIDKSVEFHRFLLDQSNSYYLQSYLLMCTGMIEPLDIDERFANILGEYNFQKAGNYSFSQLFDINEEWYMYFEGNAWPCGTRRHNECRRGVDKQYVDDIMMIRRIGSLEMDDSIKIFNHIQYINFCVTNKCPNIYQPTKSTLESGWEIL
jgi:hypothetical protein